MKKSLRRSQLEIFVDVLNVMTDKPLRLSHITLKAKINFLSVKDCLNQLSYHDLIEEKVVKRRKQETVFFGITKKGRKFLTLYQKVESMFKTTFETKIQKNRITY